MLRRYKQGMKFSTGAMCLADVQRQAQAQAHSADIFVAVCVSARSGHTHHIWSGVAATPTADEID
jgi:hypothetical protein